MRLYDFKLSENQEKRARRLHDESIVIDMLFQGPMSPYSVPKSIEDQILKESHHQFDSAMDHIAYSSERLIELASEGHLPEFKSEWYDSGITAGNRELSIYSKETIVQSIARVEQQFNSFDWLIKATKSDHILSAKENNQKAGIITCQETIGLGKDLSLLEALYKYGLRVVQLTYNNQNFIGSGCGEENTAGLSVFGKTFIKRLNELGIIVDTGHCNKQTTIDACHYSTAPVIASHTGVESLYGHMRCKSDEELIAIAQTGGVIGIFNMPWFIHDDPQNTTLEHFLDHVDYVVKLVGEDHVGIGTDWPMTDILPSLKLFKEKLAHTMGFQKGDGPSTEVVKGLEIYGSFINITRGLVSRGYSDQAIKKIIGGNWMRVFETVWRG